MPEYFTFDHGMAMTYPKFPYFFSLCRAGSLVILSLAELDLKFAFSEHYGSFMFPIEFSGSFVFVVP